MGKNSQHRKYLITQNNPNEYGLNMEKMKKIVLSMEGVQYVCGCEEIGESGTPHIHIFFYAPGKKRFSVVKKLFPQAHIDPSYGSCNENRSYLLKEGKWSETSKSETSVEGSFWEHGTMPAEKDEESSHAEMMEIQKLIEDGAVTADIIKKFPKYTLQTKKLDELQLIVKKSIADGVKRDVQLIYVTAPENVEVISYVYGRHSAKDVCRITNYGANGKTTSFDNYQSQDILVFDCFKGQIPVDVLLVYLSSYPVMLPARYTDRPALYSKVYILSTLAPDELYCSARLEELPDDQKQNRRLKYARFYQRINLYVELDADGCVIKEERFE